VFALALIRHCIKLTVSYKYVYKYYVKYCVFKTSCQDIFLLLGL